MTEVDQERDQGHKRTAEQQQQDEHFGGEKIPPGSLPLPLPLPLSQAKNNKKRRDKGERLSYGEGTGRSSSG